MKSGKEGLRAGSTNIQPPWEFILFNVLSNVATFVNFIAMHLYSFPVYLFRGNPILFFFVFHYTQVENDLGLGGFLSFLVATAAAQTVNFYVQKNFVFRPMQHLQEPYQDTSVLQWYWLLYLQHFLPTARHFSKIWGFHRRWFLRWLME